MPVFIHQIANFLKFNNWLLPSCMSQFSTQLGGGESWNEG